MSFVKNVQLLLLLCLPSLSLFGQSPEDASTWNESYLDSLALYWPDNTIENPIGAPAWNPKKGKRLTIVQLGDSHIQGDFSSCATRNYLTDRAAPAWLCLPIRDGAHQRTSGLKELECEP